MATKEKTNIIDDMDDISRKIAEGLLREKEGKGEEPDLQTGALQEKVSDEDEGEAGGVGLGMPKLRERPGGDKRGASEEGKVDGRGTSGRISEPDFETVSIEAGTNFLQRILDLYRKGAEILDRRKADTSKTNCSICGEAFPEGKHRGESVFSLKNDPNRYQVFRFCSDRCALIFGQNSQAYRTNDQSIINRIKREFFVKRISK